MDLNLPTSQPASFRFDWRPLFIAVACLVVSLVVFSPRLSYMMRFDPNTFECGRAKTFLTQCLAPLRTDVERAMRWRLLPPVLCFFVGLHGKYALLLPLAGVAALAVYAARIFLLKLKDARSAFLATLLVTTSSAVLVPLHWFGMNDAWVWLGLLAVTFGRARWISPVACLLCPWIDERFILGLPIALFARWTTEDEMAIGRDIRIALSYLAWLSPYLFFRLLAVCFVPDDPTFGHLEWHAKMMGGWAPHAPLGWWMAWRVGWVAIAAALVHSWKRHGPRFAVASVGVLSGTLLFFTWVAADLSRSAAIVLPLTCQGTIIIGTLQHPPRPLALMALAIAQLLVPAAHAVGSLIVPIHWLPIELTHLFA